VKPAAICAVLAAALVATSSAAAACDKPKTSLASLEGQVMCPVCHTTLDQSDSLTAQQIERFISVRIARCESAQQIKDELVENYGTAILAAPPGRGFDLLAWWLPLGGVIVGAALLAFGVWRWTHTRDADSGSGDSDPELDAADEQRLDELLSRLD
jgi:cytochrome c-type biogenesis protein CcmH